MPPSQDPSAIDLVNDTLYVHLELDSQAGSSQNGASEDDASQAAAPQIRASQEQEGFHDSAIEESAMVSTQADEFPGSFVEDTQYKKVELDTQAPPDPIDSSQRKSQQAQMPSQNHDQRLSPEAVPYPSQRSPGKSQLENVLSQKFDAKASRQSLEALKVQFKEPTKPALSQSHNQKLVAFSEPQESSAHQSGAVQMAPQGQGHGQVFISTHDRPDDMSAGIQPAGQNLFHEPSRNFDVPFSRSAIPEPSPEKFTFDKARKFNTENLTRIFPSETGVLGVPALANVPRKDREMPAPPISGAEVSDKAPTTHSRTRPYAILELPSELLILQTEEIFEGAPKPSAPSFHISSASPVQPHVTPEEVLAPPKAVPSTQIIGLAARDSVESGSMPASTNTLSTKESAQQGSRRIQRPPFAGFLSEEGSAAQTGSSTTATTTADIEPMMNPVVEFLPQELSRSHMPTIEESTHNRSHESHNPEGLDETKLAIIARRAENILALREDQTINAAREKDNGESGGSRTGQGQVLPAPATRKLHHQNVVPSLAPFHGFGEKISSDPVSAPSNHSAPQFGKKPIQPHGHSTTSRAHSGRDLAIPRMHRAKPGRKGSSKRETLRRPASPKQPNRYPHDLPPLSKELIRVAPFPDQKLAPRGRVHPIHALHQSTRASIPANPLPAGNSANDRRRRTPTTASPLSVTPQKPDVFNRAGSIMHDTKKQACHQVLVVQNEAERYEIKTGVPHVPNERSTTRSESVLSDSPHPAAFAAVPFAEGELSPQKYSNHDLEFDGDMGMHRNHGNQMHGDGFLPRKSQVQIEADMEEVHIQHPRQKSQGQFDHYSEQSQLQETRVRSVNAGDILQKPQLNLSNHPQQQPQSHTRATSRHHNMRPLGDRQFERSQSPHQDSAGDVSEGVTIPQEPQSDLEGRFQALPPPAEEPSRRQNSRETGEHGSLSEPQQPDEHQSQQQSIPSRPCSRRSNIGTAISSRPMRQENLQRPHNSTPALGVQNAPKIQKSVSGPKETFDQRIAKEKERERANEAERQEIRQNVFELKLEQMEVQKNAELEKERNAHTKTKKTVEELEVEKLAHLERIARFQNASNQYRDHVNGVVRTQDYLTEESSRMGVSIAKLRVAVSTEAKHVRSLLAVHAKEAKVVEDFRGKKEKMYEQILVSNLELEKQVKELNESKQTLRNSEAELTHKLELEATKIQGLKNQFEAMNKGRQEFAEILKEIPGSVAGELVKKDGILAKLLSSQNSTQSKVDEVIALVTSSKDATAELSPTFKKAVEDFFTELENKLPSPSSNETDPAAQIVDDLKAHFDAAMSVLKVQDELKNQITKIEKTNTALKCANEAQTNQLQGLTDKIEELQQALDAIKTELEKKKSELETLRANPPENPQLVSKVHDLETRYNTAQQTIDAAAQDSVKDKQELKDLRESIESQKKQVEQLDLEIKSMNEDKVKNEEANKLASQKLREEYEKAQLDSKTTMKQEHQAELKNWEQKQADVEFALNQSREETQKVREEHNKILPELDKFKGFVTEAEAQLQRAEEKRPRIEDSNKLRAQLKAVQEKFLTTQRKHQFLSETFSKQEEFNSQRYQDFAKQLNCVDELVRMNEALARQNLTLGKKVSGSQGQSIQYNAGSNASSMHSTPRTEPAEQQDKSQPALRTESRPALRKPSTSTQAQSQSHVPWTGNTPRASGTLASSPNMTSTGKRSEKGVTFSNELSYSETPPLLSSPANSETPIPVSSSADSAVRRFYTKKGALIRELLPEFMEHLNGVARSMEVNQSNNEPSQTSITFSRNYNVSRSSVTTQGQEGRRSKEEVAQTANVFWRDGNADIANGNTQLKKNQWTHDSSSTAVTFSKTSKEKEARQGQQKLHRGVLKPYGNTGSAPIVENVHTPDAMSTKHNLSVGEGHFSGNSASARPLTARGHSQLIQSHHPTYQPENLESPHQGSSGRYTNLQKPNGKRSAAPGKDNRPQKRRALSTASQTRSRKV